MGNIKIFISYLLSFWSDYKFFFCSGYKLNWLIGLVGRVLANGPGDLGTIPDWVIPKTLKMVLDTSLLNTQQNKVRIEGKVEQSKKRISTFPYTLVLYLLKREPSGHPRLQSPTLLYKLSVPDIDIMVRVFANGPEVLGSIPRQVIPKTQKMVLDASLLNTQHYKVQIKGKMGQSW